MNDEAMAPAKTGSVVRVPTHLNPGPALRFIDGLRAIDEASDIVIDFQSLEFARPFGTLLVAEALRDLIDRRRAVGLPHEIVGVHNCGHRPAISYLGHVGFFTHIGSDYGKQPGQAPGSQAYVPVTVISKSDLPAQQVLQNAIDHKAQQLAAMIFQDGSSRDMLQYCLRETIRNVFEHARVESCTLMAQRYAGEDVEIAIADRGIGIAQSLSETHAISVAGQALKLAIKPGISRVKNLNDTNPWGNSGFGLYVLSRLGIQCGSFRVASSGMSLEVSRSGDALAEAAFPGTIVGLRVNTRNAEYFPNILQQVVQEGERALGSGAGSSRPASMSTVMTTGNGEP